MLLLLVEGAWLFGSLTHNYVRVWIVCAEMTTTLIAGTDKHVLFDQDVWNEMKLLLDFNENCHYRGADDGALSW